MHLVSFLTLSGDVIRIQPNHISFCSLEALEAIHGPRTKTRKGECYNAVLRAANTPGNLFNETY
jgi:hypothetical protein